MKIELEHYGAMLTVEFEYQKGSDPVWYYPDGSGHPGDSPEVDIISISSDNFCFVLDKIDTDKKATVEVQEFYSSLEDAIIDYMENVK